MTYIDEQSSFISESSVYRLLKAHDLITSPAYILMQERDKFQHPTIRVNEMWQTDFTYFKITGWGWYYLSTVLDDFSRFIIAWRLCASMSPRDVSDTFDDALRYLPVAPNILSWEFSVNVLGIVWVSDITYMPTDEGWLYLAGIKDLFNGGLVGYAMNERMTKSLVIQALFHAIASKHPDKGLITHSD